MNVVGKARMRGWFILSHLGRARRACPALFLAAILISCSKGAPPKPIVSELYSCAPLIASPAVKCFTRTIRLVRGFAIYHFHGLKRAPFVSVAWSHESHRFLDFGLIEPATNRQVRVVSWDRKTLKLIKANASLTLVILPIS